MTGDPVDPVAGEERATLREAFSRFRTTRHADGTLSGEGDVPPELAEPFVRALERVQDELHTVDVAAGGEVRDGGRLRADAFVALLLRVTDPADRPGP